MPQLRKFHLSHGGFQEQVVVEQPEIFEVGEIDNSCSVVGRNHQRIVVNTANDLNRLLVGGEQARIGSEIFHDYNLVPHSPQNLVPGSFSLPHFGHTALPPTGWPHSLQNLVPCCT